MKENIKNKDLLDLWKNDKDKVMQDDTIFAEFLTICTLRFLSYVDIGVISGEESEV